MILRYAWLLLIFIPGFGAYADIAWWISAQIVPVPDADAGFVRFIVSSLITAALILTIAYPIVLRFVFKKSRLSIGQYAGYLMSGLVIFAVSGGVTGYLLMLGYVSLVEFGIIHAVFCAVLILVCGRYLVFGRPAS